MICFSQHDMSRGPAPGPLSVLRGHQTDVQALAFHPALDVLYSGYGVVQANGMEHFHTVL